MNVCEIVSMGLGIVQKDFRNMWFRVIETERVYKGY